MILSDRSIKKWLSNESLLRIIPYTSESIQPASYDLHLGKEFKETECYTKDSVTTFRNLKNTRYLTHVGDTFLLKPKSFVLATTVEKVSLPSNLSAFVEGRSSVGRTGLFIHNAGFIDPGFRGQITLELFNASDWTIELESGVRIAQLVFITTDTYVEHPYEGKYQNQKGVTESRIYEDDEVKNHEND